MKHQEANSSSPTIKKWVSHRLSEDVEQSLRRLANADGVKHLVVMPDVHLAADVCVGTVLATDSVLYPAAVGGDIGCGILTIQLDADADRISNQKSAAELLNGLYQVVPRNRHSRRTLPGQISTELADWKLSDERLEKMKHRDARVQLGTLGRGNHFLEFQSGDDGQLWVMIHSGSRSMGQAITAHHLECVGENSSGKLVGLNADSPSGQAYFNDMQWARTYAEQNRLTMLAATLGWLKSRWSIKANLDSLIHTDHNHVEQEIHFGSKYWVHRKGAQRLAESELGVVPGSMGTCSFIVSGRACAAAMESCSHGAGRALSRTEARHKVSIDRFAKQMQGVWFDRRKTSSLRDESPEAYKDVRKVMRCQRELVRFVAEQRPVLSFKGS